MKYINLIPLGENFLVERTPEQEGTIVIPDAYKEHSQDVKVIRAGKGKPDSEYGWDFDGEVAPGDTIMISKYGGHDLSPYGGEGLLIVPANCVLGLLEHGLWPVGDQVLVELFDRKEKSEGGIFLPDSGKASENWGIVKRVGGAVDEDEIRRKDEVFIGSTQGTLYRENGKDYVVIRSKALHVIRKEEKDAA
jgi:chaperonin GroES